MRFICLSMLISLTLPILSVCAVLHVPSEYATLADALQLVQEGDTVLLEPGTYSGLGFQDIEYSGPNCWIIGSSGADNTIIDAQGTSFIRVYAPLEWDDPFVGIEGITFTQGDPAIEFGEYAFIYLGRCVFSGNDVALLDTVWYGHGEVDSCDFVGNGTAFRYYDESLEWFHDCVFILNGAAVNSYHGGVPYIERCLFVGNSQALSLDWNAHLQIANCCLYRNSIGIVAPSTGDPLWIECSDVYGNSEDYHGFPDQTGINGNISQDPLFCDTTFATLGVASISPLLPAHNDCGVNIGNVSIGCYCGDIDTSGQRDISDLTFLVSYMFDGGPPPNPSWAGDVDGSGGTDISDVTYFVDYLFSSGPDPEC